MTLTLQHPGAVMNRLLEIENDLALRQNELEEAAMEWFRLKRDREQDWATEFLKATGTDQQRRATATAFTSHVGVKEEGRWEGLRAVVRVLEARATIGQSILRSQSRV